MDIVYFNSFVELYDKFHLSADTWNENPNSSPDKVFNFRNSSSRQVDRISDSGAPHIRLIKKNPIYYIKNKTMIFGF